MSRKKTVLPYDWAAIMICIINKQNMLFIVSDGIVLLYRHVSGKSTCCLKLKHKQYKRNKFGDPKLCVFNKPRSFWLTIKEGPQTIHIQTDRQTSTHTFKHLFWSKSSQKRFECVAWFWVWIALVNLLIMSSSSSFSS